ncbi:hypothetical protein AAY473_038730, partial [Plecturocebus cupreus]
MENECEESSELGFRRWIINFCELKEYVLNQCKETNNFEKRFDEMLICIYFCLPNCSGKDYQYFVDGKWVTLPSQSSKRRSKGDPVPFTLHQKPPCRSAGKTTTPVTRVMLVTRGALPLGISKVEVSKEDMSAFNKDFLKNISEIITSPYS